MNAVKKIKIGIDIRPLETPQYGGVSEYINNLLPMLFEIGKDYKFVLFRNSFKKSDKNYSRFLEYDNVKLKSFRYPNKLLFFGFKFLNWPKVDKLLGGVDFMFCPHFFPISISKNCKRILTFHDLSFVNFPDFFDLKRRIWHKLVSPKKQVRTADKLISVSDATKQDLVKLYGIFPEKITTVYSGINKNLLNSEIMLEIKNLPPNYILSLCVIGSRKNLISLIRAFDTLKQNDKFGELHLVLAGGFEKFYKKKIKKEIEASFFKDKIVLLGPVSEEQKIALYKKAQIFVYPSLYEGFGFPPLEAMYCGVPTIVSHSTSLPEITGGAALLIDPYRPNVLAEAMEELLVDKHLHNYLLYEGRKRAEIFDWKNTAKETLRVILDSWRL